MTDVLSFTPAVSPYLINHESYENRESFSDVNCLSVPLIAVFWPRITDAVRCK